MLCSAPLDSFGPGLIGDRDEATIAAVENAILIRPQCAQITVWIVLQAQISLGLEYSFVMWRVIIRSYV